MSNVTSMETRKNTETSVEARLKAVEDRMEIQALAARFSDAVNERDINAFSQLWASDHPVWEIGSPLPSRAEGKDAIISMLKGLYQIQRYFMQMTHSGVITINDDRATARFVVRERGKGDGYYDNLAVYDDVLVREPGGWRFLERHFRYRFLDQTPFAGDAFPVTRCMHPSLNSGPTSRKLPGFFKAPCGQNEVPLPIH